MRLLPRLHNTMALLRTAARYAVFGWGIAAMVIPAVPQSGQTKKQDQPPAPSDRKPERRSRPGRPVESAGTPTEASVPAARRGGGCNSGNTERPLQIAIVRPISESAQTAEPQPKLFWYVSRAVPSGCEASFTLTCDPRDNGGVGCGDVEGSNRAALAPPDHAGVHLIETAALKGHKGPVSLKPGIRYRWYVSVGMPQRARSADDVAGWWIERATPKQTIPWYDSFAAAFLSDDDAAYARKLAEARFMTDQVRSTTSR